VFAPVRANVDAATFAAAGRSSSEPTDDQPGIRGVTVKGQVERAATYTAAPLAITLTR